MANSHAVPNKNDANLPDHGGEGYGAYKGHKSDANLPQHGGERLQKKTDMKLPQHGGTRNE